MELSSCLSYLKFLVQSTNQMVSLFLRQQRVKNRNCVLTRIPIFHLVISFSKYNCELILETKTNLSRRRKNHLHNSGNYRAIKHHWLHVWWAVINCEQSVGFELMRGEFKQWLHWSGKAWRVHYEHSVFPDLLYISVLPRIQVTTLKAFPAFPMPIYCI